MRKPTDGKLNETQYTCVDAEMSHLHRDVFVWYCDTPQPHWDLSPNQFIFLDHGAVELQFAVENFVESRSFQTDCHSGVGYN
jgi:hypothetical protein